MNIIKKHFLKKEFEIVNSQKNNQSIVLRDEKIINPKEQNIQHSMIRDGNGVTHKLVLAINEKLSVYGVGEVSSYDLNKNGKLIMDLSLYEHELRINNSTRSQSQ
ncbi:hypothetical protein [Candidatus Colwellia aromaticivorans]|uniref:hypothetical protein n=1 Tax=Candidatus Colwellia aromaticivorans TaxID=2267621 RepID=UPI000DF3F456|nr:hypothetical protein [Candidatus Colwellia aromaticivorans]